METSTAKIFENPAGIRKGEEGRRFTLWMSIFLVGIVFFLSADELIGAVYLRSLYTAVGMLVGFSLILILVMLALRKHISRETLIGWSLVGLVIALCATVTSPYTSLIGWLVVVLIGASFDNLPFMLGAYLVIGTLISTTFFRIAALPAKLVLFSMILLVALYSFGVSAKAQSQATSYNTSIQFNDHRYIAFLNPSWTSSSPDNITLYECNRFALLCQNVYEKSDWFYTYESLMKLELVPDPPSNTISLHVDNEIIYTHNSKIETE